MIFCSAHRLGEDCDRCRIDNGPIDVVARRSADSAHFHAKELYARVTALEARHLAMGASVEEWSSTLAMREAWKKERDEAVKRLRETEALLDAAYKVRDEQDAKMSKMAVQRNRMQAVIEVARLLDAAKPGDDHSTLYRVLRANLRALEVW